MCNDWSFAPLQPPYWNDFVTLFGERGACGGCWCMLWRLSRKEFEARKGEGNRRAMKAIVDAGQIPGILAFHQGDPVGWCAVGPRSVYPALSRSRILRPVDDRPCWSIACLFIAKPFRRRGVSSRLLVAASDYARSSGAKWLEGYPVALHPGKNIPPAFAWTGIDKAFRRAGFEEVARRSPTRPIMRLPLVSPSRQ